MVTLGDCDFRTESAGYGGFRNIVFSLPSKMDLYGIKVKICNYQIGHEMFDVIWNICDLANLLEIDLEESSREKRDLNNQRVF